MTSVRVRRQAAKNAIKALGLDSDSDEDAQEVGAAEESSDESEDSDEEANSNDYVVNEAWEHVTPEQDGRPHPVPEFLGTPGVSPTFQIPSDVEAGRGIVLEQFLNSQLMEQLQVWTNTRVEKEVAQYIEDDMELPYSLKMWKPCTADEMRKLIGTLLYTGTTYKPELASYWSTDLYHHLPYLHKPQSLPRMRFQQLLSWFRCYDARDCDETDPLCKIRPFLDTTIDICKNNYMPQQDIAIDETLVLYKGRLLFKQYMPRKKARFGIKLYCLTESATGYLRSFVVHSTAGKNAQFGVGVAPAELSVSERIVVELSCDLLNFGYRIYCDSWFTSARLMDFMLLNGTTVTGTVRKDRGVPQELVQKHLNPPSNAFMRCGDILAIKTVDRRCSGVKTVYMLDSAGTAQCSLVSRTVRGGEEQLVTKPRTVLTYNRHMGGVDRLDAACQPYSPCRRTYKWFTKLALHLLLQLVRNSWLVYRHLGGTCTFLKLIDFTVQHLIESSGPGRVRARLVEDPENEVVTAAAHIPSKLPPSQSQRHPTKRCRMCHRQGQRKRTVFCCRDCAGRPGLCLDACFVAWHHRN